MVTTADVERARQQSATDKETHDTVLIAAAFCVFKRYANGLATWQPHDPDIDREIGQQTARLEYVGRDYKKPLEAITAKQGFLSEGSHRFVRKSEAPGSRNSASEA